MQKVSGPFTFRQFQLIHGDGVWKVGTDSILLGSWCRIESAARALDMGTGTGILAMMLAQRNENIHIDAVDILPEALEVARTNTLRSKWKQRIAVIERDLVTSDPSWNDQYDLVICNPPYYPVGLASSDDTRRASRQGLGFSLWDVPGIARGYLRAKGALNVVIPAQSIYHFIERANACGLYVHRRLAVKHNQTVPAAIVLLELSDSPVKADNRMLMLYENMKPTQEYVQLCANFISL